MDAQRLMERADRRPLEPRAAVDHPPATGPDPAARLACRGDLDLLGSGELLQDVESLIALGYRHVYIELDGLHFCDVVGLGALLQAKQRLTGADGSLTLSPHTCASLALLLGVSRLSGQLDPRSGA